MPSCSNPVLQEVQTPEAELLLCQLTGPMERLSLERFQNLLPLDQSILAVWPYVTLLAALMLVCFSLSYVFFMRQEIRWV
ncbi:MAG: hypothetical protein AAB676_18865 [Verrucomicrobiota bacterium]